MRPFRYLPKVVQVLLLTNAIVFVLGFLNHAFGDVLKEMFMLVSPFDVYVNRMTGEIHHVETNSAIYQFWRCFTYAFLHGNFWHLFFNMWTLWLFGSEVCDEIGSRKFLALYAFSGVFAALFSIPFYYLGVIHAPILGASGALMGIYWAYYKFFPERTLLFMMIFPVKMKYFIWVIVALDVFSSGSADGIAHYTHLGGILAGAIFIFFYEGGFGGLFSKVERAAKNARGPKFKMNEGGKRPEADDAKEPEVLEGEVFDLDEDKRMDEILKKVNRDGIHSLSDSERQFLLKAGDRIRRRRGGM